MSATTSCLVSERSQNAFLETGVCGRRVPDCLEILRQCGERDQRRIRPLGAGAIRCLLASAHVMRPLLLSSHRAKAWTIFATALSCCFDFLEGRMPVVDWLAVHGTTTNSVDWQGESSALTASASLRSMVSPYFRRTSIVLRSNQHSFLSGVHSATSCADFRFLFTCGDASVRFKRSRANAFLVAGLAAHSPLSCASLTATMCSMSVSSVGEARSRIWAVDVPKGLDDVQLDRLRVRVVSPFIGGTPVFRGHDESHEGFGLLSMRERCRSERDCEGQS